jgi:hypothetical protein
MPIAKVAALQDIDSVREDAKSSEVGGYGRTQHVVTLYSACIGRYASAGSPYALRVAEITSDERAMKLGHAIDMLEGVLLALRSDIERDRLRTFEEMIHSALFDDLLSAAQHFVDSGHRMPAAVMAGGTLEEHLRQLAKKFGIDIVSIGKKGKPEPKGGMALNDELFKANAFSKPQLTMNQTWIHIRNQAAHVDPEFARVPETQVQEMIGNIRAFMASHPA